MNKDLLQEKRQREKGYSLEQIEKDIIGEESHNNKKAKLEESNLENIKINQIKLNEINISGNSNNLENEDISELVFKYNSINTNIKCKICQKDVSNNIKFYCNTCSNFIFCINCFILSKHPKSHNYHIIDNLKFPLYTEDWSANEEHKLLSMVSKSGLNNWEEICKSMDNKGQVECESHYYSFYYTNKENPYPDEKKIILDDNKNIINDLLLSNKNLNDEMILKYSSNQGNKVEENEEEEKRQKRNLRSLCVRKNSKGGRAESISEILGCKPKRKEFDNEFLNDTEIEISHLEFNENNDDKEKDLKIKMDILQDYNLILKEREKRKQFIFEKGLLNFRRQNRIESKLSKDEYDLLLFMKPFNRFYENSDFYDLFEGIVIEQQLKLMLKNLNKLENEKNSKSEKISTIEDIEKYLENEKNANKGRKQVKFNSGISYNSHTSHNSHEHNKDKDNNINNNEINLLGNRIERYYEFNKLTKEKKIEEIFDEDEFKLVKEMPLARSTFYDIKLKIKDLISLYENNINNKNDNLKEKIKKIIEKYDLEKQTHIDIYDFYCKKYNNIISINENELKKEEENKKVNKNYEITYLNESEELKDESISSNKHKKKYKKREKLKNSRIKKNDKDIMIIDDDIKNENINHINNNIDINMDIEMESPKENEEIKNKEKKLEIESINKNNNEEIKEIKEEIIHTNNNEINSDLLINGEQKEDEKQIENEEKKKEIKLEQTKIKYFEENNV